MKKFAAIMLSAAMVLSLAACGGSSAASTTAAATQAPAQAETTKAPAPVVAAPAVTSTTAAETKAEETKAEETKAEETKAEEVTLDSIGNVYEYLEKQGLKGKIGLMTQGTDQSEEWYRAAQRVQAYFGEDNLVVDTFPANATAEQEATISKTLSMASDPDIKVIVFNQAVAGTLAAITKVKEVRDDIICIACNPGEDYDELAAVADVVLCKDQIGFGEQVANLAVQFGAKNFVHYSFPRHMSNQNVAKRCEVMREICEKNGINFMEVTAPDPMGDAGTAGTVQFCLEDVPRQIKELGEDTLFFSTNIAMSEAIIKSVVEGHALYGGQSDPSPFDAFPAALGIEVPEDKQGDSDYMCEQISKKLAEKNMTGRVSSWTTSLNMSYTYASVLYAYLLCDGIADATSGDNALKALAACYKTVAGDGAGVSYWTNNQGKEYDNVFKVLGGAHIF